MANLFWGKKKIAVVGVNGNPMAKRIVEAHGGFIRVASTPDVGSTFEIVLPLEADIGPNATYKGNQK